MCLYADVVLHLRVNCCIPMVRGANQRGGGGGGERKVFPGASARVAPNSNKQSNLSGGPKSYFAPDPPNYLEGPDGACVQHSSMLFIKKLYLCFYY